MNGGAGPHACRGAGQSGAGGGVPRRRGAVGVSECGWQGQERPRRVAAEEPAPGAHLPPGLVRGYVRPSPATRGTFFISVPRFPRPWKGPLRGHGGA